MQLARRLLRPDRELPLHPLLHLDHMRLLCCCSLALTHVPLRPHRELPLHPAAP